MARRFAIALLNLLWYSIALAIVLAAALATLGREVLPQLRLDNDRLSAYLGERLHARIALDDVRASWVSLLPEFRLHEVHLQTDVLDVSLNNVRVDVDVWRSLYTRRAVLDRLELDSAQLVYTPRENAAGGAVDIDNTWRVIYALLNNNVHIRDVAIDIRPTAASPERQLHVQDFRVEKTFFSKKVFLRLLGRDGSEDLHVIGRLSGDSLSSSRGEMYVKLSNVAAREWLPPAAAADDPAAGGDAAAWAQWRHEWQAADWQFNGELWFDWDGLDHLDAVGTVSASQAQDVTLPQDMRLQLSGNWRGNAALALDLHSMDVTRAGNSARWLQDLHLTHSASQSWRLQAGALDLARSQDVAQLLPATGVRTLLESLHLQGQLQDVDLQWNAADGVADPMRMRAHAVQVSSGAWLGVPAFTQVDGYVDSGLYYGFIDLDSRNGFSMHYPGVYHEPLAFTQAKGRVQWQVVPEEKTVLVGSDYVTLEGDAGHARGNFHLRLPMPGADFHAQMTLAVGLRDTQAMYRDRFLPYILPEHLLAWLKNSIGNAKISDAGFLYRGALVGHEEFSRAVQFYADFSAGDLQFDPHWPRLTGLHGRVLVDDGEVSVHADGGQLFDSAVQDAMVYVQPVSPGLLVSVAAQANGAAVDGLRILRETPLHTVVGSAFDSWDAQGSASTRLQLAIPLEKANAEPMQDVEVSLRDVPLAMKDTRLQFDAVNGALRWRSQDGLSAPALQAQLFGHPVALAVSSRKTATALSVNVTASGRADIQQVAQWSQLTPLQLLRGDIDYNATLALGPFDRPSGRIGQLQLGSDLAQLAVPLPSPFTKQAGDRVPFTLAVDLYRDRQDYRACYGCSRKSDQPVGAAAGLMDAAVSMREGKLFAGDIALLGAAAELPVAASALRIHGDIPDVEAQPWLDVVNDYVRRLPPNGSGDNYPVFELQLGKVHWRDMQFPDVGLQIAHRNADWQVQFDSSHARGRVLLHDDHRIPDVQLSLLSLEHTPQPAKTPADDQPVELDFASVPSANIAIEHFVFNSADIGQMSARLHSAPDELRFENLLVTGPGYAVRGSQTAEGALLRWQKNAAGIQRSAFQGLLHMQGEQPALTHLGFDAFVRGENVYLTSDLDWPGSPLDIKAVELNGNVLAHGINGKYYQTGPTATMQLVNVFNIATWARRLRLDFSDLSSDGISFDEFRAGMAFHDGSMHFTEPMSVKSPSSSMLMSGDVLLRDEKLDLQLEATLPVGNNATWIAALAGGLPTAAGVYLVSKVFGNQLDKITTLTYSITGSLKEPDISFKRMARPQITQ